MARARQRHRRHCRGVYRFANWIKIGELDRRKVCFRLNESFVCLILLSIMAAELFYLIEFVERLVCPWHASQRTVVQLVGETGSGPDQGGHVSELQVRELSSLE